MALQKGDGPLNAMTRTESAAGKPAEEYSVPWFWPLAAGMELAEEGMKLLGDTLNSAAEAEGIAAPPAPDWDTMNGVVLDLDTTRVRDFSRSTSARGTPVLTDAPCADSGSTIADYAAGQGLVETSSARIRIDFARLPCRDSVRESPGVEAVDLACSALNRT